MATPTNKQVQDALALAAKAIQEADETIASSQALRKRLEEDLQRIEEANRRDQAAIDQEILSIIQEMDEATLQFIKDTE